MTLPAGSRLGPYEIVELVGAGGMGEVYRARDSRLPRDVAIKVLPPSVTDSPNRRARFEREAQAVARLNHPNICAVYDVGEQDGLAYFVMEYLTGETLAARLRNGALPWDVAVRIAIQIASAIDAAHGQGIVHRDLKPPNVLLVDHGVKLLDFGVAKLVEPSGTDHVKATMPTETLTAEHRVVGTLNYMAPEQLEGRPVDARTDIFALGAMLYEMLTGGKAFDGSSSASVTAAVLATEPPPVRMAVPRSPMPVAIDHIIRRALAKRPDDRWQTARDVMHELQFALEAPHEHARRSGRYLRLAIACGVAGLLMGGATAWWSRRAAPAPVGPQTVFPVPAPDGTQLGPGYGILALSPNGQRLAFIASENSVPSIWIRDLDNTVARKLPFTEGANSPFWSPDGLSLAFYADGNQRIKRISLAGGAATLVTDLGGRGLYGTGSFSAFWLADDTIVFGGRDQGLWRVAAGGGTPVSVAMPDPSRTERTFQLPSALPGGRLMYLVTRGLAEMSESQVRGASGVVGSLADVRSNTAFVDGYLVFRDGSDLVAQAFDPATARLSGPAWQVATNVDFNPGNNRTVFSVTAGSLAYRVQNPRKLTWFDRAGNRLGSIGEVGRDWNPSLARDGSLRVAVDRFDETQSRVQIWLIDEQGRSTPLTFGNRDRFATWFPGGPSLAFVTALSRGGELRRVMVDGRGGGETLASSVVPGSATVPIDIAPDGRLLVVSGRPGGIFALDVSSPDRTPSRLTDPTHAATTGRVSPDGKWLAYTRLAEGKVGVWVQPYPGTGGASQVAEGFDPAWRENSRELYFMTANGTLHALPVTTVEPLAFGAPVGLFSMSPGAIRTPMRVYAAAPNGQRFLMSEAVGNPPITVVLNWQHALR